MARDVFGLLGSIIGQRYRVDAVIGEGGFGVVYRGFHLALDHAIAIKCLKVPAHFADDAQQSFLQRFREEGKLMSRLSEHPSIVRVFDFGVQNAPNGTWIPYLVLEWLNGRELSDALKERGPVPMPEVEALRLLWPAIDALALAHSMGVAHRDIKPANLFLTDTQRGTTLKVLDFGIAKAMQDGENINEGVTFTQSGFRAFSPRYGAPEQFRSKVYGPTGPWTDVHALGLVLVELLAGRAVLAGEEHADFYELATSPQRPTPRSMGIPVSDGVEALCARAVARMPGDRFSSAREMLEAVNAVLSVPAHMASVRPPSMAAVAPPPATAVMPSVPPVPIPSLPPPHMTTAMPSVPSAGSTGMTGGGNPRAPAVHVTMSNPAAQIEAPIDGSPQPRPAQQRKTPTGWILGGLAFGVLVLVLIGLLVLGAIRSRSRHHPDDKFVRTQERTSSPDDDVDELPEVPEVPTSKSTRSVPKTTVDSTAIDTCTRKCTRQMDACDRLCKRDDCGCEKLFQGCITRCVGR